MSESALERARAYLERRGWPSAELTPLQGDASTRSYYRAALDARTEVLLVESEPGGVKLEPFVSIGRFLEELGLFPPRLLDQAFDLGVLALEDLGSVSLRRALEVAPTAAARRALFAAALEVVARLQGPATRALTPDVYAFGVRFDAAGFGRELHLFADRYLGALRGLDLAPGDRSALDRSLGWLAEALAAAPQVLTHRDFHIDNLFVTAGRIRLIDFQDARWGPASYDPASLLNDRDVHLFLAPGEARGLLRDLVSATGADAEAFAAEYPLAVAQRCLKAVGTFADQALGRGRTHYLEYVVPTLARARAAMLDLPEMEPLLGLLERAR